MDFLKENGIFDKLSNDRKAFIEKGAAEIHPNKSANKDIGLLQVVQQKIRAVRKHSEGVKQTLELQARQEQEQTAHEPVLLSQRAFDAADIEGEVNRPHTYQTQSSPLDDKDSETAKDDKFTFLHRRKSF